MKILSGPGFGIYIYNDDHPPPHCHVIFRNKQELIVMLPLLKEMFGKQIPKKVKEFLIKNLEELIQNWETKHPERN